MSWEISGSLYESRSEAATAFVEAFVNPDGDERNALAWLERPTVELVAEIESEWPRAEFEPRTFSALGPADLDDDDLTDALDRLRFRLHAFVGEVES